MKRLKNAFMRIAMLVAVVVCVTMLPAEVSAETVAEGTCGENLTWTLDDAGVLTISGTGYMAYYSSSTSAPWYTWRNEIKSLIIEDGVTDIGDYAFSGCTGLTSVTIGNGVTIIGDRAFEGCTSLTGVYITDLSVWCEIDFCSAASNPLCYGKNLYVNGELLTALTWPAEITEIKSYAFYNCTGLTEITIPDSVTSIGWSAFYGCTGLTEITIPDGVTSIGDYAFRDCTGLTSVTIGSGVTGIGKYAFSGCTGLTSVTIGNGVTSIGSYAFDGCTGLTEITIPDSVTRIGNSAFYGCSSLESITIPFVGGSKKTASDTYQYPFGYIFGTSSYDGGVAIWQDYYGSSTTSITYDNYYIPASLQSVTVTGGEINRGAFQNCSMFTSITLPDGVTSIGSYAFDGCTGLTEITIPDSVTRIGNSAFYGCTGLTSVTIGNGVTSIGSYAFDGCTSLTSITVPDSVTSIGGGAFSGRTIQELIIADGSKTVTSTMVVCESSLKKVTIPDSVTSIGDSAFEGCTGLTEITIPDRVTSIGSYAFDGCTGLTSITIPDSVTSIGDDAFSDCKIQELIIADGSKKVTSTMVVCESSLKKVTIPDSVTSIGYDAFYKCTGLMSITIPDSVTSIGFSAFSGCTGLTHITVPDSVTSIGDWAFKNCTGLTSITIPNSVTSIGWSAFSGCTGLTSITIPDSVTTIGDSAFSGCTGLTSITIPDSVTSIGECAFSACTGLTEITIPNSVTSIGDSAFSGCTGLTEITIPDSIISIGWLAFDGCTGLTEITIPNSVTSIGRFAFSGCTSMTTVYYNGTKEQKAAMTIEGDNDPLVNATWLFSHIEESTSTIVNSWGITLNDEVVVKFNMTFTEEILADEAAYVEVKVGSTTMNVPVSQVTGPIQVPVMASQMTEKITLCIVDGNGVSSEADSFTVRQYCETILGDERFAEYHELVKEMLNYGSAAQLYFNKNTDDLAGQGITDVGLEDVPTTGGEYALEDQIEELECYGATLVHRDKIGLRYYFNGDLTGCAFAVNGVATELQVGTGNYVEVADILPQDLDKQVTLTVTDAQGNAINVTYCPMNYIVRMNQKGNSATRALVKALYNYHLAAKAYSTSQAA